MATIISTNGRPIQVDDCDLSAASMFSWNVNSEGYAVSWITSYDDKEVTIRLHRMVTGASGRDVVDHINLDRSDNRSGNLRVCSYTQNSCNRGKTRANKTGFKGVCLHKKSGKYQAQIAFDKKKIFIGRFNDSITAARAYDAESRRLHGEFAFTNFKD